MKRGKKILSILIKIIVGLGSLAVIYFRLRTEFTPEKTQLLYTAVFSPEGMFCIGLCILLIPLNWGIEAYKWKIITSPIQWISYRTATKSVYSGVCLGNLAPARATEFLARIIYFKIENRPKITVLHFVGGMFQLSITIIAGFTGLMLKIKDLGPGIHWITVLTTVLGITMLMLLILCIYRINDILNYITRKISKEKSLPDFGYKFTPGALVRLFGSSAIRYAVFFVQFFLLLYLFDHESTVALLPSMAVYYLFTSAIPVMSFVEGAVRAAIAIMVFNGTGISITAIASSALLIWIINIIVPSIAGYYFLVRQKFSYKLFRTKQIA